MCVPAQTRLKAAGIGLRGQRDLSVKSANEQMTRAAAAAPMPVKDNNLANGPQVSP